jgi:hypothetical protein
MTQTVIDFSQIEKIIKAQLQEQCKMLLTRSLKETQQKFNADLDELAMKLAAEHRDRINTFIQDHDYGDHTECSIVLRFDNSIRKPGT